MPQKTKKLFTVKCGNPDCGKEFDKLIEILPGTEYQKTEQSTYCPWCKDFVTFTIDGKPPNDIYFKFNIS